MAHPCAKIRYSLLVLIGFPKGDYARPPGRKGRVIKDDPSKYPDKEDAGPFTGVAGGWPGGEVGLLKFIEDSQVGGGPASGSSQRTLATVCFFIIILISLDFTQKSCQGALLAQSMAVPR